MNNQPPSIDRQTLAQLAGNAENELAEGHLHLALDIVANLMPALERLPWRRVTKDEWAYINENYARLLDCMAQGMEDPMRENLYRRLVQKTHTVLQDIRRTYDVATGQDIYTQWARKLWKDGDWNTLLQTMKPEDIEPGCTAQDCMFCLLWTAPQLTPDEERQVRLLLFGDDTTTQSYMMSALTLALMHYFDAAKLQLLAEHVADDNPAVALRATLGVAVAAHLHPRAIPLYPKLHQRLTRQDMTQPQAIKALGQLQYYVALYRDTERLQQKLEKEILPALIQVSRQRINMGFEDMDIDLNDPESTPNVSKKTRRQLADGLQEMARLFQQGADVNLSTFTSLKTFPFFRQPCHWLAPYDATRMPLPGLDVVAAMPLCDNDKYSVAMLLQHMPDERRQQLTTLMQNAEGAMFHATEGGMDEARNIVQTLYRCLRRSPWRALWPDIFDTMMLTTNDILGPLLQQDTDYLDIMANTLLRSRHYDEAEQHLQLLAERRGSDARLLALQGQCMQEQGHYARAANYYQQATMLAPEDDHLLYRLQYCHARAGRLAEQMECLALLEKRHPDEPKVITEAGLCLMQLERWEEAQKRFYKLELKGQRVVPSLRAIAWCALRMKDYTLAARYYDRILGEERREVRWEDFLNAAHTAWLQDDIRRALPLYREYMRRYITANPETKNALAPFEQDAPILHSLGKNPTDIALMHDLIGLPGLH